MKKSTLALLGLAGATGLGFLLLGGDANAAPSPAPTPAPDDLDDDDLDDDDLDDDTDDESPDVDQLPPGELPTDDLLDEAEETADEILKRIPPPPDRVTVDPIETEPPTPVEDDDLLERVKKELPEEVRKRIPKVEDIPDELPAAADVDPVTEAMVVELLTAERSPNWKYESPKVAAWQRMRGLTTDSKFGPGSARVLAQETGLLPIVRYWPRGSGANPKRALQAYRADLAEIAADAESPRKEHLLKAMTREQGQGFGSPPKPIATRIEFDA